MFAEPLVQIDPCHVRWGRGVYVYFGGCDYLRLSFHPKIRGAVAGAVETLGLNVAASRKTTGNHPLYAKCETELSRFYKRTAVLASSGYLTNLAAAQSLRSELSHLFYDERSHASMRDAIDLCGCKAIAFKHRDAADLARKMKRASGKKSAILTDGVFSHDGSLAPLDQYASYAQEAILWVDDSHSAGVFGPKGRGTLAHFGIPGGDHITTLTFSKAFGVYGGAILSSAGRIASIVEGSRILTGNTPLPLPLVAGVIESVRLLGRDNAPLQNLWGNIHAFREFLGEVDPGWAPGPVYGHFPKSTVEREKLAASLKKRRIFPSFIRYPGGPPEGYFRFALSAAHTREQLGSLADAIRAVQ